MKKMLSAFLVALTLVSFTPRAKAGVGLLTGAYVAAAIGGASAMGGLPLIDLANKYLHKSRKEDSKKLKVAGLVAGIVGSILWVGGGYLLNGETSNFEFQEIKKSELSRDEVVYNSELAELNAVKDMIAQEISKESFNTIEELNNFIDQKWKEYGQVLSPETLKVRSQIIQQLTV